MTAGPDQDWDDEGLTSGGSVGDEELAREAADAYERDMTRHW